MRWFFQNGTLLYKKPEGQPDTGLRKATTTNRLDLPVHNGQKKQVKKGIYAAGEQLLRRAVRMYFSIASHHDPGAGASGGLKVGHLD